MTKKIVKRTDANNETLYFYTHSDAVDVGEGNATTSLTNALNNKADASDVQALSNTVNTKASASDLQALSNVVATKASTSDLNSLNNVVLKKTEQALTQAEKDQVHNNLDSDDFLDERAVRYDEYQVLGPEERELALVNLGLNGVDAEPTKNSQKMVRSGGVAGAIDNVQYARFDGIQETSVTLNTTTTATADGTVLFYVPNNVFIYKVGSTYYTLWNNTNRLTNGFYNDSESTSHALTTKIFINTGDGLPYSFDGTDFTTVAIDDEPTPNSDNLVKSGGVQNEFALGAVYDVSAKNPTAGLNNDGKWESLSALLSDANLNTLIPLAVRKGGMSIKFVQSSDNKYVQYRYMSSSTAVADFTNVANWQGVDVEPTVGSKNLVTSGGVFGTINVLNYTIDKYVSASGNSAPYTVEEVSAQGYIINKVKIAIPKNTPIRWYSGFTRDDSFTPKRQLLRLNGDDECIDRINYYDSNNNGYQEVAGYGVAHYIIVSFYINGSTPCKITNSDGTVVLWESKSTSILQKIESEIGDIDNLETSVKTNLVAAINHVEETKVTPASESPYSGPVDANSVKGAIDALDGEIDAISDSYSISGNLTDNKILTVQDGNLVELDNNDFIISDAIVYTNNTYIRWYAGQDGGFSEPRPRMVVYVDGQTPTTDNAYNYYGVDVDNDGNHYTRVKRAGGSNRVKASFKKGGICKITDDEGNILWSPNYGSNVIYVSSEKVLNPISKQSVQSQIDELEELNGVSDAKETKLFLGSLVNGTPTSSADISSSTTDVCMQSLVRVPFMKATLRFKLPDGIVVGVRSGNSGVNANTSQTNLTESLENGDTFTFGDNDMLFRIFFKRSNGDNLSPQEIYEYIENGELYVTYNEYCPIVLAQSDCDKYAKAVMVKFHTGSANKYKNFLGNIPVFAHISDIHGDAIRLERFMQYCDSVGIVDAALNSGDTCAENFKNGVKFNEDIANAYKTLLFTCVGNHDIYNNATEQGQYENIMSYQDAAKYDVTWSNEAYPTSFYRDFSSKKIRLIVLNQWTAGAGASPYWQNMSQAQVDMFVGALKNCPEDYGIIVMSHNTENPITKDSNYAKFFQDPNYGFDYTKMTNSLSEFTTPITDIIDAYIGKTAIDKEYIANTNPQVTITVDDDFTSAHGEFICWISGHNHNDFIGYNSGSTHKQLILNINCGEAIYGLDAPDNGGCQSGDVPRGGNGATQDSFNIYAIDRDNKTVKVARIGSNMTYDLKPRDYMVIPYAD